MCVCSVSVWGGGGVSVFVFMCLCVSLFVCMCVCTGKFDSRGNYHFDSRSLDVNMHISVSTRYDSKCTCPL